MPNHSRRLTSALCSLFVIAACSAGNGGSSTNNASHGGAANSAGSTQASAHGGSASANAGASTIGTGGTATNGGTTSTTAGIAGTLGAGGSSNGSAGNAGTAGTTGAHGAGCTAAGLLFCDDFEKLAVGPVQNAGPWSTAFNGPDAPTIVVDATTPAHSGTHSVMVHALDSAFQSFLIYHDAAVLPRAQGSFYLRAYVRLSRAMADHHNAYLVFDRTTPTPGTATVRLGEDAQMLSLTVGGDSHGSLSSATFYQDGILGPHFVASTWGCLEGYFNSAQPEIDFWLDGAEIPAFHHTDWPADSYDTLRFGFEKYAGPELDIWFDDIAISATRIGCQ